MRGRVLHKRDNSSCFVDDQVVVGRKHVCALCVEKNQVATNPLCSSIGSALLSSVQVVTLPVTPCAANTGFAPGCYRLPLWWCQFSFHIL